LYERNKIKKFKKKDYRKVLYKSMEGGLDKQVKGFLGTQDIIFLGLNPSLGHFPSKYDKFFYEELRKNGFKNAHITDLIKIKAPNKKINELLKNEKVLKEQLGFLIEEIKIIKPRIIVVLGKKCEEVFSKNKNFFSIILDVEEQSNMK